MGQLQEIEPQLSHWGYQIIAISADRPEKLRESMERHSLHYLLLSDSTMTGAQAFGLAYRVNDEMLRELQQDGVNLEEASGEEHHLLPVPAVFIVGTDGRIKLEYANPDHKVRFDPKILLAVTEIYAREG